MAERDTRKVQEDSLFDLLQLNHYRGKNNPLTPMLLVMVARAKNGMTQDEVDAVYKRVAESFIQEDGTNE